MEGEIKTNTKFVTKTKLKRKQSSTVKNTTQPTSGNNFIQIQPAVIEFAGFEVGKLHSLPLKIINRAPTSQRITVLPLQSQGFTFKMDKRGQIPTGMAEVVHIEFIPGQYKYFSDYLRINTETQNFQVPIHAYPILMTRQQLTKIIPKVIDFGTLSVGQSDTNDYAIPSNMPISFEFQFVYKKESPQITIEPMKGVIEGYEQKQIKIKFTALKKITSSAEVYLNINQYGFEPILISIIGTGKQKQLKPIRPKSSKNQKELNSSINSNINKNKPLLQPKRLSLKQGSKDELKDQNKQQKDGKQFKQSAKDFTKSLMPSIPKRPESARRLTATINSKVSLLQTLQQTSNSVQNQKRRKQKEFLERFNEVFNTDKQKQIKFAIYFGDTPLTQSQIQEIKNQRINDQYDNLKEIENLSANRHFISENRSLVSVNRNIFQRAIPNFSMTKNDVLKKRQKLLERFSIAASKVLITNRMIKRLRKIQQHIQKQKGNHKQQSIASTRYSESINSILSQSELKVKLTNFSSSTFKLQFEDNSVINKQLFQINATTEFDDLCTLELLQSFEPEMMAYDQIPYPPTFINHPVKPPSERKGAEEEYPTRGPAVPAPQVPQTLKVYGLPPKLPFYQYILEHPTIKFVEKPNINNQDSLNYLFENINRIDDQYDGWSDGDRDALRHKFMKGIDVPYLSINGKIGTEDTYDIGFVKNINEYCPKQLDKPELDDPFSDQDSDNQEYPSLPVAKAQELSKKIEGDNKDLQAKREKVTNQLQQNIELIDSNLSALKIRGLNQVPSLLNDFNKRIQSKEQKLVII